MRGTTTGWSNVFGDFTEQQVACVSFTRVKSFMADPRITDANGDTVTYHFTGLSPKSFPNEPPPNHTLLGAFDIVRGTGRWGGISGNGFSKGHGDGPESPNTRSGTFVGTVYLPDS